MGTFKILPKAKLRNSLADIFNANKSIEVKLVVSDCHVMSILSLCKFFVTKILKKELSQRKHISNAQYASYI